MARLTPEGYRGKAERAIVTRVTAWDANCPQHIPLRVEVGDVEAALVKRDRRIAERGAEVAALRCAGTR